MKLYDFIYWSVTRRAFLHCGMRRISKFNVNFIVLEEQIELLEAKIEQSLYFKNPCCSGAFELVVRDRSRKPMWATDVWSLPSAILYSEDFLYFDWYLEFARLLCKHWALSEHKAKDLRMRFALAQAGQQLVDDLSENENFQHNREVFFKSMNPVINYS